MKLATIILALATTLSAYAQTDKTRSHDVDTSTFQSKTFYLINQSDPNDTSEILNGIRSMVDPHDNIWLVRPQNAIIVNAPPEEIAKVQKLLTDLDRPRKTYRLTYTIAEYDGTKRVGVNHYSMVVVTGQVTTLKQGSKVPVATGTYNPGTKSSDIQTQFTYLDVGMNFTVVLDESEHGARLNSKVEQSSVSEKANIANVEEPVIRQAVLSGTSFLTLNKPLMLGSVDIVGTTRRLDVEVIMEQVQ